MFVEKIIIYINLQSHMLYFCFTWEIRKKLSLADQSLFAMVTYLLAVEYFIDIWRIMLGRPFIVSCGTIRSLGVTILFCSIESSST